MSTRCNVLRQGRLHLPLLSSSLLAWWVLTCHTLFKSNKWVSVNDWQLLFCLEIGWYHERFFSLQEPKEDITTIFVFLKHSNSYWADIFNSYKTFHLAMLAHNNGFLNLLHAELPWRNCCSHLVGPPAAQRYGMRSPFGSKRWNVERKSFILDREASNQVNLLVSPLLDRFPARRHSPLHVLTQQQKSILV